MGYFIVDEEADVVALLAKLDALQPERLDLWIGTVKDCSRVAAMKGINPATIKVINSAEKALGYKNPLRIHLCGRWADHAHLRDIQYFFKRMADTKIMDIEFVTE